MEIPMINRVLCSLLLGICALGYPKAFAQDENESETKEIVVAAERMSEYLPLLEGKRVGLVINQTSVVNGVLLPDTLLSRGVMVKKIYSPEHGFRGEAEAGDLVENDKDKKTGLPIVSLYGKNKKPTDADLKHIDIMIYDIQDVGVRFYTYISTLQYVMEACVENDIPLLILDRPNPNGHYVDGPVLDTSLRSFVGMQPIPIVYGMTPAEYAKMLIGEQWFKGAGKLDLKIVECLQYDHRSLYRLPVNPSPNLRNMIAIYCYPTVCLFEGTVVSVGRGTDKPFQQWGHPEFSGKTGFSFKPVPYWGQKTKPPFAYQECFGQLVAMTENEALTMNNRIRLFWLQRAYKWHPNKDKFFISYFESLAGTRELRKQIEKGLTEGEIWASWDNDLKKFKQVRKKYLLYKDFE
jgi:uncharacterized protein YbbC (DUF1343 family)